MNAPSSYKLQNSNLHPLLFIWYSIYTIHLFIIISLLSLECKLQVGRNFGQFVHYQIPSTFISAKHTVDANYFC